MDPRGAIGLRPGTLTKPCPVSPLWPTWVAEKAPVRRGAPLDHRLAVRGLETRAVLRRELDCGERRAGRCLRGELRGRSGFGGEELRADCGGASQAGERVGHELDARDGKRAEEPELRERLYVRVLGRDGGGDAEGNEDCSGACGDTAPARPDGRIGPLAVVNLVGRRGVGVGRDGIAVRVGPGGARESVRRGPAIGTDGDEAAGDDARESGEELGDARAPHGVHRGSADRVAPLAALALAGLALLRTLAVLPLFGGLRILAACGGASRSPSRRASPDAPSS